jgi:SNF2 family DNA or RNA helicase
MPHVSLNDLIISISLNDVNSDIDRRTVNFFKSCGELNTEYTSFVSEKYLNIAHLYIVLSDMIKFFKEKSWTVTFDSNSTKLLSRYENNSKDLAAAQLVGSQIKESAQIDLQLPESFKRTLKDYQKKSVKHLSECGNAANFSVPGSGKTTVAYAAYSILKERDIVDKILVISPRAAFVPWEEEFKFCFEKSVDGVRLEGSRVDAHIEEDTIGKELVLSTYQLPLKHQRALTTFLENNRVLMILDESHNIKNMDAFLHKKSGKIAESIINLAPSATRRFILSGTPMPNRWDDIWTQFNFLWPLTEILDKAQYFKDYTKTRQELGPGYKKIIDPLFTRIAKKTLDLKEPIWEPIPCPLRPKQQKIYNAIELKTSQALQHLHEESISESVEMEQWRRAQMIRLIQVASNPVLLKKKDVEFDLEPISSEVPSVSELIEKYTEQDEFPTKLQETVRIAKDLLKKGEKVIIWTNFVHNVDMLKEQFLKDEKPLWIYGDVPKDEDSETERKQFNREKMIHDFKSDPNPRVLIATPASCAESISLHMYEGKMVCRNAIYVDRTYNAGQYMQSLDRIHRIGMDKNTEVTYWLCVAPNTFDETIHEKLDKKRKAMSDLLDEELKIIELDVSENLENVKKDIDEYYEVLRDELKSKKHD